MQQGEVTDIPMDCLDQLYHISQSSNHGYSASKYFKLFTTCVIQNIFVVSMLCNVWDNKQNKSWRSIKSFLNMYVSPDICKALCTHQLLRLHNSESTEH